MSSLVKLTKIQREILKRLLCLIEKSKTYAGTNKVNQSFSITPDDIYEKYYSDYADLERIEDMNSEAAELERMGLINLIFEGEEIEKIYGIFEKHEEYCDLLGVDGKKKTEEEYRKVIKKYVGASETINRYCQKQLDRLENNKKVVSVYSPRELDIVLNCIKYIESNEKEILERELSIELFFDSKVFEKEYKGKICTIMKNFGDYSDIIGDEMDSKTINDLILASNKIVRNPNYIYFKGNGMLIFSDGNRIEISSHHSIAISSQDLKDLISVKVSMSAVVTVENLTSYNRLSSDKAFIIYLSGYNNTAKSEFLKLISKENAIERWYHFGDIDPDGFYILEHLKKTTGINIKPYKMSIDELKKYKKYCKNLEKHDIIKANSMIKKGLYRDILEYILNNKCKLEQEIISWKEPKLSEL